MPTSQTGKLRQDGSVNGYVKLKPRGSSGGSKTQMCWDHSCTMGALPPHSGPPTPQQPSALELQIPTNPFSAFFLEKSKVYFGGVKTLGFHSVRVRLLPTSALGVE